MEYACSSGAVGYQASRGPLGSKAPDLGDQTMSHCFSTKVTGLGNKPMELTKEKSLAMIAGWMARIGQITKNCLEIKLQHATRYN